MKDTKRQKDLESPVHTKIQLVTSNHIGEFYFYISPSQLREYFKVKALKITSEDFQKSYTLGESRLIYDWLRSKDSKREKGPDADPKAEAN